MKGQVAIPESSEELEELLHDDGRMGEIHDSGQLAEFTQKYQGAWKAKNALTIREMAERQQVDMQAFMKDQADKHGARAPEGWHPGTQAAAGSRRSRALSRSRLRNAAAQFERHHLFDPAAIGAELEDAGYQDSLRQFIWATLKGEAVAARDGDSELAAKLLALKGSIAKTLQVRNAGMSERIPSEGGFLVPETLRSELFALMLEESVISDQVTTIPMDSLRVPLPTIDDTTHVGSVFGGVSGAWTAEGAALDESEPKFSRLVLIANKLTAYTEIPNELLQDSITAMDVWFNTFFPQALAFFRDLAFIAGDGVDQPLGLVNAPGAVTVTDSTSQTVTYADVVKMFSRMWPGSLKNAVWLAAPDAIPQLAEMAVTSGSTTVAPPVFLPGNSAMNAPGGLDDGRNFTLFGRPGIVSEKAPTWGKAGTLGFYDLSKYLVGDRQAMQIASSAEYKFGNDKVAYRVIERLDGRPWVQSAITPANGSANTLSPYVLLETTA
ncbi:MAG TPA: phage major capsid protein [Trebonia sp.]